MTNLLDYDVLFGGAKALLQVLVLGEFAFGDIDEHVGDLENVIDVCLDTRAPFLYFVLVARDLYVCENVIVDERTRDIRAHLEPFPAFLQTNDRDVCQSVNSAVSHALRC